MAKKMVIKTVTTTESKSKSKSPERKSKKSTTKVDLTNKLIENTIALQRVNVEMTEKFEKLTNQISDLLALFEMAARNFANNPAVESSMKDKEFLDKIDTLLEQNKTIAKGLTLMEDRVREKVYGHKPDEEEPREQKNLQPSIGSGNPRPLPRF